MAQSEFDAFLDLILSLGINYETTGKLGWNDKETYDPFISWDWITGGLTGGNCWGSSADRSVTAEDEPIRVVNTLWWTYTPVQFVGIG